MPYYEISFTMYIPEHGTYKGASEVYHELMSTRPKTSLVVEILRVMEGLLTAEERQEYRAMPKYQLAAIVCEWETARREWDTEKRENA